MENLDIIDIDHEDRNYRAQRIEEALPKKQKLFRPENTDDLEEILIYYGDERGNIRILDISKIIVNYTNKPIGKARYYPEQKVSFIPKRKGNYQIDSIADSLRKMANSQTLQDNSQDINYSEL